jgi:hypothetical protein
VRHFHLANAIDQPVCKHCGIRMVLARIMPDGVVDVRSFECPKCYRVLIERVPTDPMEQSKGWLSSELKPPR